MTQESLGFPLDTEAQIFIGGPEAHSNIESMESRGGLVNWRIPAARTGVLRLIK